MRAAVFVVVFLAFIGVFIGSMQPKKKAKRAAHKAVATQKAVPKQTDPAFEAGFTMGFMMAKSGQKKPAPDEIDAMARRQSFEAGPKGGRAYAYSWKSGFGMGWSRGD